MTFTDLLRSTQRRTGSLLCIGLDADPRRMPAPLRGRRTALLDFNRRIIDATHDLVCAYKINLAFAEAQGERSWNLIARTLSAVPRGILTIADGKRGDIGNSAEQYATALFDGFRFDACTVSPYMGEDSVAPFLRDPRRGAFVLALTSNPGARDFQYLRVTGRPLYERIIAAAKRWNVGGNAGLVVGATRPAELRRIRSLAGTLPILIPGVGAQGGDLAAAVRYGCDRRGEIAVVNAGRSVLYASEGKDFARAARAAAQDLRDTINRHRDRYHHADSRECAPHHLAAGPVPRGRTPHR